MAWALALLLLLAGCASSPEPAEPVAAEEIETSVALVTGDGRTAANMDDDRCQWGRTQVVVRDGAGEILATEGPDRMAGQIVALPPDYRCRVRLDGLDLLPAADFYEFEIETDEIVLTGDGGTVTAAETLDRDDVESRRVEIEVGR